MRDAPFFTEQNKQRLIKDSGSVPGLYQVKGILSIIEKMCLLFIASNTMETLLAQALITNSVRHLRGLFTWSSCLSLSLRCEANGKPWGMVCRPYSISSSKDKTHQYQPVILSDRDKPGAESPSSEWAPRFVMLSPSLFSMNMNGLFIPEHLKLLFCRIKKVVLVAANEMKPKCWQHADGEQVYM